MARKPKPKLGATAVAVGKHLDMSKQRVGQFADEGVFPRLPDSSFDLDQCRVAYIGWLRDDQRRSNKNASQNRVTDARAREIELRIAREENTLIETDEALDVLDEILGSVKSEMSGIPARVTRDIELRRKIETEIDDVFRRASERFEQKASDLRESGEAVPVVPEDDT